MFWKGVLGYLPVNVVQAVAGFGAIVVFTRMLSPSQYGDYALAFSVTSVVYTCLFVWVESAMARFYAAEDEAGRLGLYATLYRAFAAMAVALPLVAGVLLLLLPISGPLKLAMGAGLVSITARSLLKMAQERRRAAGEVRGYAVFDMAQTGGGFGLGAAFAVLHLGGASPLLGAGVASAACLLFALPSELRPARQGRFERERLRRYVAYGLPISLSLLMGLALATTDRFVLAAYMNEATVGAYHAGYSLSNRTLDVMFMWLGMAGGPACIAALERGGQAALERTAREQASFMVLIAFPAAAGLALVAHPLAELMVGPALRQNAARVTPWIALSGLFYGLTAPLPEHRLHLGPPHLSPAPRHRDPGPGQSRPHPAADPPPRPRRRHVGDHRQLWPGRGRLGAPAARRRQPAHPLDDHSPERPGHRRHGAGRLAPARERRRPRGSWRPRRWSAASSMLWPHWRSTPVTLAAMQRVLWTC